MQQLRPILCLNCGSSSLKFALFRAGPEEEFLLCRGAVERIGAPDGTLWFQTLHRDTKTQERGCFANHEEALATSLTRLASLHLPEPCAIGHRVVHGGPDYTKPVLVDEGLIATLKRIIPFAPLHLPSEIQGIEAVAARFPHLPQISCFDTAFHRRMPELAQRFALPHECWDQGIRRYGFHGLSYEYILSKLGSSLPRRLIIAHLGSGASMAAIENGIPIDTTMGFTPAGGIVMGTRTGDLDPGILIHLARTQGLTANELDAIVNLKSGLLGVSGISSDMKLLLERSTEDARAALAVEMFCYTARKAIGSLAASLTGLDLLVFTGGIGERAVSVRSTICEGLEHLGIRLNQSRNESNADTISTHDSRCRVRVIPTNEDVVIARESRKLLLQYETSGRALEFGNPSK